MRALDPGGRVACRSVGAGRWEGTCCPQPALLPYYHTCSCGSISSGHRTVEVTMAPFSTDRLSAGRPSLAHCACRTVGM